MILRPTIFSLRTHQPKQRLRPCTTLGGFAILLCISLIAGCGGNNSSGTNASAAVSAADVEAAMKAAEEYLASREYTNAELILDKLLERKSDIVEAWELLGQVKFSQAMETAARGEEREARTLRVAAYDHYSKAVALQPESAGLQHAAGMMALSAGDNEAAAQHFATAGRLDSANIQHPLYEAQVLLGAGKLDEAEVALERAHAIDADEPFTISSLAVVAMEREDYERAIEWIELARSIDPRSLDFRVQEARIRRRAGQPREAIQLLQPLGPAERGQKGVAFELASSYEAIGDYERAAAAWAHRWEADNNDWRAALNAAADYVRIGNHTTASILYDAARKVAPNEPEVKAFGERLASIKNSAAGQPTP